MGERKVLVRYVPPDFDPSIIPKFKHDKNRVVEVRMMLPFSMRCLTCGEYMGMGKKFNSIKEICWGEDYMGIRKIRFRIKCSMCSAEIAFKTDPKNSGYECEAGASRNFELWAANDAEREEQAAQEEEDEKDALRSLENRTIDSKVEMDILDALDEIKSINQRHEHADTAAVLERSQRLQKEAREGILAAAEEEELKNAKFHKKQPQDMPSVFDMIKSQLSNAATSNSSKSSSNISIKKKKRPAPSDTIDATPNKKSCAQPTATPSAAANPLSSLLGSYGSGDSD